jgi:hypothetical protein
MTLKDRFFGIGPAVLAIATFLAVGSATRAQSEPAAPPSPPPGPGLVHGSPGPGLEMQEMRFLGFEEGLGGKTVTGAPFSASFSTQNTQALTDGNKINRSTSGAFARDSQGRTRRELTLSAIGPWADSSKPSPHVVLINDAVAQTHYVLEPDRKIARQIPAPRAGRRGRNFAGVAQIAPRHQGEGTKTSLGTQTIGGVSAEGTRYTRTIPAGQIGNEKPIEIVTERWYSPDLQTVVMFKHSDPRSGETVFQLTNIQRQEPDASLFLVPSDYTMKKALRPGLRQGQRPMRSAPQDQPPPPQPEPPEE